MTANTLIPLTGFTLPDDFPWRVRFIAAVDDQLKRLRASGHFLPPRFFGYYFQGKTPVGVSGSWTVRLDPEPAILQLQSALDRLTAGRFSIASGSEQTVPEFLLVHDRHSGACWLWNFSYGLRFVETLEPVLSGDDELGMGDTESPKLLGP